MEKLKSVTQFLFLGVLKCQYRKASDFESGAFLLPVLADQKAEGGDKNGS